MTHLKVVEFPHNSLADLPQKMRDLADAIEEGHFGTAKACVVVLNADLLQVFGLGSDADSTVAHYLLACAQRKLEQPLLDRQP